MNRSLKVLAIALLSCAGWTSVFAQRLPATSKAQQTLAAAAADQKYTFLVFYRDTGQATQAMAQMVKRGVESRPERATVAYVSISDPSEKALVDRFDVSRAPMPLTIAVAPNGAITGLLSGKMSDEKIERSFVTPGTAACMKSMQEGKLVLACVQSAEQPATPPGVSEFCEDPQFKDRAAVVFIHSRDPAETEFLQRFGVSASAQTSTTVFWAPPGVLVGMFSHTASKDQLAAALHKAGKCCDDENCKHNHASQPR